ncbi:hypothetical protein CCH79_00019805 [Gambusia affinis]|uniref:Keratin type II head domain-containing protein n=1 Tax=Gambusia affinis TaxID=33528 RepID=A0A315W035_GAMAF|nr:hypothetical protein CCH79_00019805 [Gambusia affinis]
MCGFSKLDRFCSASSVGFYDPPSELHLGPDCGSGPGLDLDLVRFWTRQSCSSGTALAWFWFRQVRTEPDVWAGVCLGGCGVLAPPPHLKPRPPRLHKRPPGPPILTSPLSSSPEKTDRLLIFIIATMMFSSSSSSRSSMGGGLARSSFGGGLSSFSVAGGAGGGGSIRVSRASRSFSSGGGGGGSAAFGFGGGAGSGFGGGPGFRTLQVPVVEKKQRSQSERSPWSWGGRDVWSESPAFPLSSSGKIIWNDSERKGTPPDYRQQRDAGRVPVRGRPASEDRLLQAGSPLRSEVNVNQKTPEVKNQNPPEPDHRADGRSRRT